MAHQSYKHFLLQTSAEQDENGQWSASFAIFAKDRKRTLVYWMPSLFRPFGTSHEAERAALRAGQEYVDVLGS